VLDAALALWGGSGASGAPRSVHRLAARAKVSIGSIYHHFGSVDGVAAALYARSLASLLDAVATALPTRERGPRQGVEAVVRAYVDWTRTHQRAARFVHASSYAPFLATHRPALAAERRAHLQPILAWFAPFIDRGELAPLPAPFYEVVLVGPVAEWARRWLDGDAALNPARARRALPARVWGALAPTRAGVSARPPCPAAARTAQGKRRRRTQLSHAR
jgi:AcrR family transcriptional regulator